MKKTLLLTSIILTASLSIFFTSATTPIPSSKCTMTIKSGWNLMSVAELTCGVFSIESNRNNGGENNFPAYLDLYAYDGSKYLYTRYRNGELRDVEKSLEKYLGKIIEKTSNGEFSDINSPFLQNAEESIRQNDTQKIKEYAGRYAKEIFTSIWVYNPSRDFSVVATSREGDDGEESLALLSINALTTNINSQELSQTLGYIAKDFMPLILSQLERDRGGKGLIAFLNQGISGGIILDSGWNFLTYNKASTDINGNLNFTNGDCTISKAFVFDNSSKKWIKSDNVDRSMFGSGMVVYNSGKKCSLIFENEIIKGLKSMINGGSSTGETPPSLPVNN